MADNVRRYGLRWVRALEGAMIPKPFPMVVKTGYQAAPGAVNVDLNVGDAVIEDAGTQGTVIISTVGGAVQGVIVGIGPYFDGTKMVIGNKLPGGTTWGTIQDRRSILHCIPPANQIFEIVAAAATVTTEAAHRAFVGRNADIIITPDATQKRAYMELDLTTVATTNTLGFRILDIAPRNDIDFTGKYVPYLVTPNFIRQAPYQTTGV